MTVYLDTSALVKLYVEEPGTDVVRQAVQASAIAATSEIAYVELRAALARRRRQGDLRTQDYHRLVRAFHADWPELFRIALGSSLIRSAGEAAERFHLRAYDAVHLASGLTLHQQLSEPVTFACWDVALSAAAEAAGLLALSAT